MTETLRRAFELVQQQPEEEQEVIAQLILEELGAEEHWNQLLTHPKSAILLERMAEQARKDYAADLTRDLDELL